MSDIHEATTKHLPALKTVCRAVRDGKISRQEGADHICGLIPEYPEKAAGQFIDEMIKHRMC